MGTLRPEQYFTYQDGFQATTIKDFGQQEWGFGAQKEQNQDSI